MMRRLTLALTVAVSLVTPGGAQSGPPLPVLTRIRAIRTLSQDDGARGYPVRIRATVTHFDEVQSTGLLVHDGQFGQFVLPPTRPETTAVWRTLRSGDDIEIEGRTVRGGFAPNVQPDAIRKIGRAPLPSPKNIPYAALLTGRYDCDYVEIGGVVQRAWVSSDPKARSMYAEVAIEEGVVRAAFWDYAPKDLDRFIDARVRLRGPLGALFGHTEQLRGVSLFGGRTRDVVVLEPPPDPFSLPMRPIRSIYNYSSAGEVNRRIRVRGVVICQIPGRPVEVNDFSTSSTFRYLRDVLYVKDGVNGGARIETEQSSHVRPGDLVDVVGFPAITPGKPILRNAVFRVVGSEAEPAPGRVAPGNVLTPENDAELVSVQGQFLSVLTTPTERVLVLKMGETVFDAGLDKTTGDGALNDIRPGSLVSITGVYSYQAGPPPSFRLLLRSPRRENALRYRCASNSHV